MTRPKANASVAMAPTTPELYSRLMLERRIGYPLYEPDPDPECRSTGVRVGDIGWVTPDGVFDFLFNITHGSPPLPGLELVARQHFRDGEHVLSDCVERTEDLSVIYSCVGKEVRSIF